MNIGIITARGGSKGIPNKNMREMAAKPLIQYTIEAAINSGIFHKIIVTSDSDEILNFASNFGLILSKRPSNLSTDESSSFDVITYEIKNNDIKQDDMICLLQPTSPLRSSQHIKDAYDLFKNNREKSVIGFREANEKIEWVYKFDRNDIQPLIDDTPHQRQNFKNTYLVINGAIYFSTVKEFLKSGGFFSKKIIPFVMNKNDSIDIDTIEEFNEAENIISKTNERY